MTVSRSKKAKSRRKSKKLKARIQRAGSASTPVVQEYSISESSPQVVSNVPVSISSSSVISSTLASAASASAAQASAAIASTAQTNAAVGIDQTNGHYVLPSSDSDQTIEINDYLCQYIRIRPSVSQGDGFIHFSQIMVYNDKDTLISPSALIYASSTLSTAMTPQILVDGTTTPRSLPNIWQSASNNRNTEFLEIKLLVPQIVSSIRIIGLGDCPTNCKQRMFFVRIELNNTTTADATAYYSKHGVTQMATESAANAAIVHASAAHESAKQSAARGFSSQALSANTSAPKLITQGQTASSAVLSAVQTSAVQTSAAQLSAVQTSAAQALISIGQDPSNGKFILPLPKTDQSISSRRSVRYIRVRPAFSEGDGFIQICQITAMNLLGKNLALNAAVYASSSLDQAATCVVDGVLRSRSIFWQNATANRDDFIEIDLGDKRDIALIRIIGPPTSEPRMSQVRVEASLTTTQDVLDAYAAIKAAEQVKAAEASLAVASAAQASSAQASIAQASNAQALAVSGAIVSSAQASAAAASAAKAFMSQENLLIGNDPTRGKFILPTNDADQTIYTDEYEGRYIRIRPSVLKGDGWLNISQVIVNDVTLSNIAAGKAVYATSNHPETQNPIIVVDDSRAVRDFPTIWQSGTNSRDKEFLEIDLGDVNFISSIQILGRGNCRNAQYCIDRMMGVRIEINEHTNPNVLSAYAADALAKIPKDPDNNPSAGRFLIQ
jgi:hypothetical protein